MLFYLLFAIYVILLIWYLVLLKQYKVSLFTVAFGVYTILIGIPFFIIYAEISNILKISNLIERDIDAKVLLPLGDGYNVIVYLIIFNFIYLLIGSLYVKKFNNTNTIRINSTYSGTKLYNLARIFIAISIFYTCIRYYLYPDFPLFAYFNASHNANLRDLAFYYGSNKDVPYIFLPSINSQFYRILLPLSSLFLWFYYCRFNNKKSIKTILYFTVACSVILNAGTFKRTPILYLLTWFFLYFYMYKKNVKLISTALKIFLIIFITLTFITLFYSESSIGVAVINLFARLSVGEAIGEFLAIEHFGNSFDYLYFDIPLAYLKKILGMNVMTFSEYWKVLSGGTRGYTSIGVIAELIISFGYMSIPFFFLFTFFIIKLDIFFKRYSNSFYRPVISGAMTIIAFMMIKGFFSQLFTGGGITLLLIYFCLRFKYHYHTI